MGLLKDLQEIAFIVLVNEDAEFVNGFVILFDLPMRSGSIS
jgi:hypothetical protein